MSALDRAIDAQRPSFFFWCPVLLGVGIGTFFTLKTEPHLWVAMLVTLGLAASVLRLGAAAPALKTLLQLGLLLTLGFTLASVRAHLVKAPVLDYRYYGPVMGRIVDISRSHGNALRITLDQVILPQLEPHQTPAQVRITLLNGSPHIELEPGAKVALTANLSPPSAPAEPGGFDFRRHAWFQGLGAIGYSHIAPLPQTHAPRNQRTAVLLFKWRKSVADAVRTEIPGSTGAFAAAILTGDRSEIDPALMENLRASNLAHLLAISGLHMGLLTGFVMLIARYGLTIVPGIGLRWPVKKIAAICALGAGAAYLALSGANVATQRAFIMAAVIYGAILFDRQAITLRSVALAALIVLILRPESLTEAGFQMSFSATTGLVVGFQFLRKTPLWETLKSGPQRFLRPVVMLFVSSALAGLATAPFSAFHFNQVAQYGLLANLFAVPMMGMIVMPCAVLAALVTPLGLHGLPLTLMGLGIDWILGVAHFVAQIEGSVRYVASGSQWVLPLLSFGALFCILWNGRSAAIGITLVLAAFWTWSAHERPLALISEDGRLIGVQTAKGRSISHERGNGFAARSWLENDGDPVSQKVANLRQGFEDVAKMKVVSELGLSLYQIRSKKVDPSPYCRNDTVLVAVEAWDKPHGDCKFLGKRELRQHGAIAIFEGKDGLRIVGAKPYAGKRLWSQ